MDKNEYQELVKKITPKEERMKDAWIAFFVGGSIGLVGEIIVKVLTACFNLPKDVAYIWLALIAIFLASLFTALGFFDNLVGRAKAGLVVPITGFAHSMTSASLDYKKDGMITGLGANVFKLAGSVILYSMISAFFLALLKVIING